MASNYLNILADIKARFDAISDIGIVHDYERLTKNWQEFLALFAYTPDGGNQQIRGWEITRRSVPEHKRGAYYRHHVFIVRGYLSLKDSDATDKTFQILVDTICETFRAVGEVSTWYYRDGENPENSPCQVDLIEPRMFGGVLCHYCEITLYVTEWIVPT
jgi:hypothetical protein